MFVRKSMRPALFTLVIAALFVTSCTMGATPVPTVDVNAINTAAVATAMGQLSAQFTQTAQAAPTSTTLPTNTAITLPTFPPAGDGQPTVAGALPTISFNTTPSGNVTPLAGFTALPTQAVSGGAPTAALGDACNNSSFEGDITIPDGTVIKPGTNFQKVWGIKNTGTCTWDDGYSLVYIAGSTGDNLDPVNFPITKNSDFVAPGVTFNMAVNLTTPCKPGKYEGHWRMKSDSGYYFGTVLSVYVEVQEKCK